MLRLETQGCWKRLLRNRPGNAAFRPMGPKISEGKTEVGMGKLSPQGTKKDGFSACLQF